MLYLCADGHAYISSTVIVHARVTLCLSLATNLCFQTAALLCCLLITCLSSTAADSVLSSLSVMVATHACNQDRRIYEKPCSSAPAPV